MPGGHLRGQFVAVVDALWQTLSGQYVQFDLGPVEPTALLGGGMDKLKSVPESLGLARHEGLTQRPRPGCVEVVDDQRDRGGLFIARCDFWGKRCPVRLASGRGYLHPAPADKRFAGHENVAPATAFILLVIARGAASRRGDGGTGLRAQLAPELVPAENGKVLAIGSL